MKKTRIVYSDDFETTTDPLDCRVWLWGSVPVDDPDGPVTWGIDIDSYMEYVASHNSTRYFHNEKFDGMFILDWLLNQGFVYTANDQKMNGGEFTVIITDTNKFYSITVKFHNGHTTEFRDSAKKLPMSVRAIAKTFNLPISKGDIDYDAYRPVGYQPTEHELDYLFRDVRIVAYALRIVIAAGMTRLTVASDSLAEYKRLVGDKWFKRTFPEFDEALDAEIRRAYRGGFTYVAERFKGKRLGAGLVLDVNSLYPYVMYDKVLPYGEPEFVEGRVLPTKHRPLTIFSVTFTAKLKPNHIPCIQIKGSHIFGSTEYLTEVNEPTTLMMTDIDFALYQDHYDMEILAWGGGWRFRGTVGLFKDYIDKWSKIKAESTGGQRETAKLHLNALYGKMGSNPNITGKIPTLHNGMVKLVRGPDERKAPIYTATAVFVTSYARELTIRAAQENYDRFVYADTDSLHLLGTEIPANIDIDPHRMGAWKHEYNFIESFYVRSKAYIDRLDVPDPCSWECEEDHKHKREYKVAWAGIPEPVQERFTFDTLVDGAVIEGKLEQRTVPGGAVLLDKPYTLNL